jgi:hypothetical protein
LSVYSFEGTIQAEECAVECCLERWGLGEGGDMNRVLRLVKGGKASVHAVKGRRDIVRSEQVALRVGSRDLGWYLADNVSDMMGRGAK